MKATWWWSAKCCCLTERFRWMWSAIRDHGYHKCSTLTVDPHIDCLSQGDEFMVQNHTDVEKRKETVSMLLNLVCGLVNCGLFGPVCYLWGAPWWPCGAHSGKWSEQHGRRRKQQPWWEPSGWAWEDDVELEMIIFYFTPVSWVRLQPPAALNKTKDSVVVIISLLS